jgi:hypothetical protein
VNVVKDDIYLRIFLRFIISEIYRQDAILE